MKNIIESQFSEAEYTSIDGLMTSLETAFSGKTATLDNDDRSKYGSVNEQNKLVVNKAREYRLNQPALSSPDINWTEFERDYQARIFLERCINRFTAMIHDLESTKIMHDYDNFQDALKDYGYSQYKNGAGESGFDTKVDEFKQFFNRTGKTKSPDESSGDNPDEGGENTT